MRECGGFGLRGSVKLCELHRIWYSRGCGPNACETEERSDLTVVEFRLDGSIKRQSYKNPRPNSSEWTNFYEYNDDGQLSAERAEQGGTVRIDYLMEEKSGAARRDRQSPIAVQ